MGHRRQGWERRQRTGNGEAAKGRVGGGACSVATAHRKMPRIRAATG
jgi:hypothetical protein